MHNIFDFHYLSQEKFQPEHPFIGFKYEALVWVTKYEDPYYGLPLDSGGLELDKSLGKAVLTIKIQWHAI